MAALLVLVLSPALQAFHVKPSYDRERTALAVMHTSGTLSMSQAAEEPRPALSLAKLYLGYWVLYNGTGEEKAKVKEMVMVSDDEIARELDAKYPYAIDEIAADFELENTQRINSWGWSVTSARDIATFVASILWDPQAKPLLEGMRKQAPVASDGFGQQFGTARLTGVAGSKMGWSDDRESATASVSFGETRGETWVVAALTEGSAYHNTVDVRLGTEEHGGITDASTSFLWGGNQAGGKVLKDFRARR